MAIALDKLNRSKLNARFHQLLTLNKCDQDEKKMIVNQVSCGRCLSSKDLTAKELATAIELLNQDREAAIKRMRAKAINLAKALNFLPEKIKSNEDWKGLNTWCNHTFKTPFYRLDYYQLVNCITGLENIEKERLNKSIKNLLS